MITFLTIFPICILIFAMAFFAFIFLAKKGKARYGTVRPVANAYQYAWYLLREIITSRELLFYILLVHLALNIIIAIGNCQLYARMREVEKILGITYK